MDATMTNSQITQLDKIYPMLSQAGVVNAKKMCAEHNDLTNPMISPLYGDIDNFPETILFLGPNAITYPDQRLAVQKLEKANTNIVVITGENMPHICPVLPVMKEVRVALQHIIGRINN